MFVFHQVNNVAAAHPYLLELTIAFGYAFVIGYLLHRILSGMAIGLAGKITTVFISIGLAIWMAPAGVTGSADQQMLGLISSAAMIGGVLLIAANTIKIFANQSRASNARWSSSKAARHEGNVVARGAHCVIR